MRSINLIQKKSKKEKEKKKKKMKNIKENLKINSEAIQWIISALRDNSIIPKISPNPGNNPHNFLAFKFFGFQIFWNFFLISIIFSSYQITDHQLPRRDSTSSPSS